MMQTAVILWLRKTGILSAITSTIVTTLKTIFIIIRVLNEQAVVVIILVLSIVKVMVGFTSISIYRLGSLNKVIRLCHSYQLR